MANIAYSAIVLLEGEREKLLKAYGSRIPEGWEVIAHHCTIKMGELPAELKENIGLPVKIQVIGFRSNDKVCAVQVIVPMELVPFMINKHPHITMGVNRAGGGKPVMSNSMIEKAVADEVAAMETGAPTPLHLMGVMMEVSR